MGSHHDVQLVDFMNYCSSTKCAIMHVGQIFKNYKFRFHPCSDIFLFFQHQAVVHKINQKVIGSMAIAYPGLLYV